MPAAFDAFTERVQAVPSDAWSNPTPCTDWDVRHLLDHMVSEHLLAPHLLRRETIESVGDQYEGDVLSDNPVAAWDSAMKESKCAWQSVDPADGLVELSMGPTAVDKMSGPSIFGDQIKISSDEPGESLLGLVGRDPDGTP